MRAVTMRKGALGRLELITRIPGHDSIAAAARVLYDGRASALVQMLHKIEMAAGFTIIDRSGRPLPPTTAGREFIQEAFQTLRIAQEHEDRPDCQLVDGPNRDEQSRLDPGASLASRSRTPALWAACPGGRALITQCSVDRFSEGSHILPAVYGWFGHCHLHGRNAHRYSSSARLRTCPAATPLDSARCQGVQYTARPSVHVMWCPWRVLAPPRRCFRRVFSRKPVGWPRQAHDVAVAGGGADSVRSWA